MLSKGHGSGRTLNDGGEDHTHQNAQNGIREHGEHAGKGRIALQWCHSSAHSLHAEHQGREAQENGTQFLLLLAFAEHIEYNADQRQYRGEGAGFQHGQKYIAALNAGEGQQPGGDTGADIGAHNNAHHLVQCHNAGIYKAHGHHGHGAGGLDHGGNAGAQQHALNAVVGHFFQHGLEFAAAHFFQAAAHHIHAKEKECQTADQA